MSPTQVERALVEPAKEEFFDFEEGLIEDIMKDINASPAALPLMSFTMRKLTEVTMQKGETNTLGETKRIFTKELYGDPEKGLGGIIGALRGSAEQVYHDLGKMENTSSRKTRSTGPDNEISETQLQTTLNKILLRLVQPNDGAIIRRRVFNSNRANELNFHWDEAGNLIETVLNSLEGKQLIVRGKDLNNGQDYIELSHDALVNNWPRSLDWIKNCGSDMLQLQRQLWQAVVENKRTPQEMYSSSYLPRNAFSGEPKQTKEAEQANPSGTSSYWDRNPKLIQVIDSVLKASIEAFAQQENNPLIPAMDAIEARLEEGDLAHFQQVRKEWETNGRMDDLDDPQLSHISSNILSAVLYNCDHWMNEEEIAFIEESWQKRIRSFAEMKRQKDEAIQMAIEAKASALAAKARQMEAHDPTIALNLAYAGFRTFSSEETRSACNDIGKNKESLYIQKFSHQKPITAVANSPDGKYMLIGSFDETAILHDETGKEVTSFPGHEYGTKALAFSPDGTQILTASGDAKVRLWAADMGKEIMRFEGHREGITSVAFSPSGTHILTGSNDGTAKLWKVTGELVATSKKQGKPITDVAFSPDGIHFLTGDGYGSVKLWDNAGKEIRKYGTNTTGAINAVAFSPDGKHILCAYAGSHWRAGVKLYELEGKEIWKNDKIPGSVSALAFSPDGTHIVTACQNPYDLSTPSVAILWDLEGKEIKKFKGHSQALTAVDFSPDGKHILTGSYDNTVRIWPVSEINPHTILTGHKGWINAVHVSSDGKHILTGGFKSRANLWDKEGKHLLVLDDHKGSVNSVAISPDGKHLFTGSGQTGSFTVPNFGEAAVWDLEGEKVQGIDNGKEPIHAVAFSPDGRHILTGSSDKTAKLWNLSGEEITVFSGHTGSVNAVAFSSDGQQILTGSTDTKAILWDISGTEIMQLQGHTKPIKSVAFSHDGKYILTGGGIKGHILSGLSSSGEAILWDTSGREVHRFGPFDECVNTVAFSPSDSNVLIGSNDTQLWDLSGGLVQTFNLKGGVGTVHAAAFSPDGESIVTGHSDNISRIWWNNARAWNPKIYKLNEAERKQFKIEVEY